MKRKIILSLFLILLSVGLVSAVSQGYKFTDNAGGLLFTIGNTGDINSGGTISENGVLLSNTYLALSGGTLTGNLITSANINITVGTGGFYKGDGSKLTGITVADDSILLKYQNITTWPTCAANQHLDADGTTLSCTTTVDVEADPIWSANFTNMQTDCGAGLYSYGINGDGTLKCRADQTGSVSYTNLAWVNETNVFQKNQNFSANITLTSGNLIINDTFSVLWDNSGSSITSAVDGTVTFKLGV